MKHVFDYLDREGVLSFADDGHRQRVIDGLPRVLWQGHYMNYDDVSFTQLFTDPVEALKAMGYIAPDGRPIEVRGNNVHWDLVAMPVYATDKDAAEDGEDWSDLSWRTQWEHYVLPLYIWKYENGKRLGKHEQTVLGLR